jgi:hypothetical protein
VHGFVLETGGRLGPAAQKFIDEVVGTEVAKKAAASRILRVIGIEVMHEQACHGTYTCTWWQR